MRNTFRNLERIAHRGANFDIREVESCCSQVRARIRIKDGFSRGEMIFWCHLLLESWTPTMQQNTMKCKISWPGGQTSATPHFLCSTRLHLYWLLQAFKCLLCFAIAHGYLPNWPFLGHNKDQALALPHIHERAADLKQLSVISRTLQRWLSRTWRHAQSQTEDEVIYAEVCYCHGHQDGLRLQGLAPWSWGGVLQQSLDQWNNYASTTVLLPGERFTWAYSSETPLIPVPWPRLPALAYDTLNHTFACIEGVYSREMAEAYKTKCSTGGSDDFIWSFALSNFCSLRHKLIVFHDLRMDQLSNSCSQRAHCQICNTYHINKACRLPFVKNFRQSDCTLCAHYQDLLPCIASNHVVGDILVYKACMTLWCTRLIASWYYWSL